MFQTTNQRYTWGMPSGTPGSQGSQPSASAASSRGAWRGWELLSGSPRSPQTKNGTYNWRITYTTGHAVSSLFICYHNESLWYHKIYIVLYRIPYIIIIILLYLHIEHNVSLQNSHVELPATSCAPLVLPPSAHPQHLRVTGYQGGLMVVGIPQKHKALVWVKQCHLHHQWLGMVSLYL